VADWVWTESGGTALTEEPRLKVAQFGDGYEQRAADGINNLLQEWSYVASEVDDAVADDMVAFLRARNGVEAFSYVPLRQTVAIKVKCSSWTRTWLDTPGLSSLRATFSQVAEP